MSTKGSQFGGGLVTTYRPLMGVSMK